VKAINNIEDFLTHPEFIRWVKQPDRELDAYWDQWRKANPELLPTMRLAKEILLRATFTPTPAPLGLQEEVLQEVLRQRASVEKPKGIVKADKDPWHWNFWMGLGQMSRVAAILVLTMGLAFIVGPIAKIEVPLEEELVVETSVLRQTGSGEKIYLTLGDGTKIWLNSSSKVEFPQKFAKDHRLIRLEGEAYFEVERDSLRPFIVHANGLTTTVLGTSFNINTKAPGKVKVSLVSGKVEVSSSQNQTSLSPGEMLDYDNTKDSHTVRKFKVANILAWKDGVLLFQKATLSEVKAELEEWFGVKIKLQNASGITWEFSGEYRQQTLEEVLESISYIKGFDYRIMGKEVTIKL
jgi:transmembrane sensor